MLSEIKSREDIVLLVDSFYQKVRAHSQLGYLFDGVAKVNWETHLPKICDFWCSIAFGDTAYQGNPMEAHIHLHAKEPLKEEDFSEWLRLFRATLNEHFTGDKAEELYQRAERIAALIQFKISQA